VNAVAIFFLFPETRYFRDNKSDAVPSSDGQENTDLSEKPRDSTSKDLDIAPPAVPKKTFLQELNPWSKVHPTAGFLKLFVRPFPLLLYPAVLYSFLTFSASVSWSICLLDTSAAIFQAPPYNFTPGINSLIYLACIIGIVIGTYLGGPFTDWMAEWFARRNGGIFEPESRLIAMIFPFFITPMGLLMYLPIGF
jgi:hypothetical protein